MSVEILIVELGEVGASIGLALNSRGLDAALTGFDPDSKRARFMADLGAVNQLTSSLPEAARRADLIVLAAPTPKVRGYLEQLGPHLKLDAVVVDTSPLKTATLAWAEELLPEGQHYVGATPVMGRPALDMEQIQADDFADAGRFAGGLVAIVTPAGTPEAAVNHALAIAAALDASPFFITGPELDVLMAAVEALPVLTSAALMQLVANAPSRRDLQLVAGQPFLLSTLGATGTPLKGLAEEFILNREHLVARLDSLAMELHYFRALIERQDLEGLKARLEGAVSAREEWIASRLTEGGQPAAGAEEVRQRGLMETLFGSIAARRKSDDQPG